MSRVAKHWWLSNPFKLLYRRSLYLSMACKKTNVYMNIILLTLSKLGVALETEKQRQSTHCDRPNQKYMSDRIKQKKLQFYSKSPILFNSISHDHKI